MQTLTDLAVVENSSLLVELLSELVCTTLRNGARRWRGLRPSERAAKQAEEREFQEWVDTTLVERLLGTKDYKLVS